MTDKERHATIRTWVEVFQAEGVTIGDTTLRRKLQAAGLIGETGRTHAGQLLANAYYPESKVRAACSELLCSVPQADEDGFFEMNGEVYGYPVSLARKLGISSPTIHKRLKASQLEPIQGKDSGGRLADLYRVSDIRTLCHDLLEELPLSDENGLIEKDGELYGNLSSLEKSFGINRTTLKRLLSQSSVKSIRGKGAMNHVYTFYLVRGARELCQGLLEELPRVDSNGFIEKDGERYGTIRSLSKEVGVSAGYIRYKIQELSIKGIQVRSKAGSTVIAYSLSVVREFSGKLLQDLPQIGDDGFLQCDGEKFGTINALTKLFQISDSALKLRIQRGALEPIQGKDNGGRVYDFYSVSKARKLCADFIAKKSKK